MIGLKIIRWKTYLANSEGSKFVGSEYRFNGSVIEPTEEWNHPSKGRSVNGQPEFLSVLVTVGMAFISFHNHLNPLQVHDDPF